MSPDGSKSPSPEEKLLRLIRGGKPPSLSPATAGGGAPSAASSGRAVAPAAKVVRRAGRPRRVSWRLPAWWLTAVNVVLSGVVVVGLGLIGWLLSRPVPMPALPEPRGATTPSEIASGTKAPEMGSPTSVASAVSRPMFVAPYSAAAPTQRAAAAPSARAGTVTQRLSLIGVVSGEPPQAIIEDAETQKTYFVTKGQGLIEGVVVEEIRDNRVVLRLGDERVELTL